MWSNPVELDQDIIDFGRRLDCDWIGAVLIEPDAAYEYDQCHNNVSIHTQIYGGTGCIGWYFVRGFGTLQAIRHTVWKNSDTLIDVTPYRDGRDYIIFGSSRNQTKDYSISNCYFQSLDKYLIQETENMYYVYQLEDPRTRIPFYIGKGTKGRAQTHLRNIPVTRNVYKENKIASIRSAGLEPVVRYLAENIADEELAYNIEASLIRQYGRKGYDPEGILTNICEDSRPPNHQGRTYEQIYGTERAEEQRQKRALKQKERGGYGPKCHTAETKKKISQRMAGENNPRFGVKVSGTDTAKKISLRRLGTKCYSRTSLLCVENHETDTKEFVYMNDLTDYCKENDRSYGTFLKQLYQNWPVSRRGLNKGLKIRYATEQEKIEFDGIRQDVTENTFKGLSL